MKKCQNCHKEIINTDTFCRNCGTLLKTNVSIIISFILMFILICLIIIFAAMLIAYFKRI